MAQTYHYIHRLLDVSKSLHTSDCYIFRRIYVTVLVFALILLVMLFVVQINDPINCLDCRDEHQRDCSYNILIKVLTNTTNRFHCLINLIHHFIFYSALSQSSIRYLMDWIIDERISQDRSKPIFWHMV
jgi:hypothetical protein